MSSKLKCPRCKNKIDYDDVFCRVCGNSVKREMVNKDKVDEVVEPVEKEDKVEENILENSSNNSKKNKIVIIILLVIILMLALGLFYFLFIKKEKECDKCECTPEIKFVEKKPTIQYINFNGYRFSIPLDWSFEGNTSDYKFINNAENMYVSISSLDTITYDLFISSDYQKMYIEKLQSESDIFINHKEEKSVEELKYYIMDGTYDSYNYVIIVTENENGVFVINAQFENNSVYTNKKDEVINFAVSYVKNNKV